MMHQQPSCKLRTLNQSAIRILKFKNLALLDWAFRQGRVSGEGLTHG
jgi:hypothetical protein